MGIARVIYPSAGSPLLVHHLSLNQLAHQRGVWGTVRDVVLARASMTCVARALFVYGWFVWYFCVCADVCICVLLCFVRCGWSVICCQEWGCTRLLVGKLGHTGLVPFVDELDTVCGKVPLEYEFEVLV